MIAACTERSFGKMRGAPLPRTGTRAFSYNGGLILCLAIAGFVALLMLQHPSKEVWLRRAAGRGDVPAIQRLVSHGATVNACSGRLRQTPLMAAAASGNEAAVRTLLQLGARLDLHDANGCSALDLAVASGRTNVLPLLAK